jgi:hypothetical protein
VQNDGAQRDICEILLFFPVVRCLKDAAVDWRDHARDIINFLTYYLPPSPSVGSLPALLKPIRSEANTAPRQVLGIGHSFGATVL